uniref:Uncharacterized protein n=1 Tax=Anguilla anguilla TaxID=7936 RepID=A0A0E9QPQ5_ANGAN
MSRHNYLCTTKISFSRTLLTKNNPKYMS